LRFTSSYVPTKNFTLGGTLGSLFASGEGALELSSFLSVGAQTRLGVTWGADWGSIGAYGQLAAAVGPTDWRCKFFLVGCGSHAAMTALSVGAGMLVEFGSVDRRHARDGE
jgi:hypothetical protein